MLQQQWAQRRGQEFMGSGGGGVLARLLGKANEDRCKGPSRPEWSGQCSKERELHEPPPPALAIRRPREV